MRAVVLPSFPGVNRAGGGRPRGPGSGGRQAARCLRAARTLRTGRAGAALHRAPRAASRSACVRGGQAEPARTPGPPCGLRASLCCSFTHVCDLGSSLHGQKWVSVIITTPALCPCPVAPGPARSRSSPALWCHLVELRRWLLCSELSTFSMG